MRATRIIGVATVVLALTGGVIAIGAIPSKDGTINACFKKKKPGKGKLRLVKSTKCKKSEKRISWNQAGETGPPGEPGAPGAPGRSALSELESGETITGAWAVSGEGPNLSYTGVTFPVPAPEPVDSQHVVIANNDSIQGDGCTGTPAEPVSSPGFVCIYPKTSLGTNFANGYGALNVNLTDGDETGDGSRSGFLIGIAGTNHFSAAGTWVYTAP